MLFRSQQKELDAARRGGYARVKIDGNLYDLDEEIKLEKNIKHTVEIVVDRLAMRKGCLLYTSPTRQNLKL